MGDEGIRFDAVQAGLYVNEIRTSGTVIGHLPERYRPPSLGEAYRVQETVVGGRLRGGSDAITGYKIACTSSHARDLLNIDAPVFGRLLASTSHTSPARISAGDFRILCIEPEYGVSIGADVPTGDRPYDRDSIAPYVDDVFPSIEIVDHRFEDWSAVGAPGIVADNAIHGAWIRGAAVSDWTRRALDEETVSLRVNGAVHATGAGSRVLGHPLSALAWLANNLHAYDLSLSAGDFVTTGVCTDVYMAEAGDRIRASFASIGTVSLEIDH